MEHNAWVDELTHLHDIAFQALCPCGWAGDIFHADEYADLASDEAHPVDMACASADDQARRHNQNGL